MWHYKQVASHPKQSAKKMGETHQLGSPPGKTTPSQAGDGKRPAFSQSSSRSSGADATPAWEQLCCRSRCTGSAVGTDQHSFFQPRHGTAAQGQHSQFLSCPRTPQPSEPNQKPQHRAQTAVQRGPLVQPCQYLEVFSFFFPSFQLFSPHLVVIFARAPRNKAVKTWTLDSLAVMLVL